MGVATEAVSHPRCHPDLLLVLPPSLLCPPLKWRPLALKTAAVAAAAAAVLCGAPSAQLRRPLRRAELRQRKGVGGIEAIF